MKCVPGRDVVFLDGTLQSQEGEILYVMGEILFCRKDQNATLFIGTRKITNTEVVIKSISKNNKRSDPWWEADALEKASKIEGVISILDCLQDKDHLYIVMPYMREGDFFSLIEKSKIPEDQARNFLEQMVHTLLRLKDELHLAHHDVSLENFMMDERNNLVMIDFGICVWENKEKKPYLYYGKPCYIAPELVYYKKINDIYASDIWSLGVCFYSMLTSSLLYENTSNNNYNKLMKGGISIILDNDPTISVEAKWLLCRMLNPDPSRRPSLDEMVHLVHKENNHCHNSWMLWLKSFFNGSNKTTRRNYRKSVLC